MLNEKVVRRFAEKHQIALEVENYDYGGKRFIFTIYRKGKRTVVKVWDMGVNAYYLVSEFPLLPPEIVRYGVYPTGNLKFAKPLKNFAELKRLLTSKLQGGD